MLQPEFSCMNFLDELPQEMRLPDDLWQQVWPLMIAKGDNEGNSKKIATILQEYRESHPDCLPVKIPKMPPRQQTVQRLRLKLQKHALQNPY